MDIRKTAAFAAMMLAVLSCGPANRAVTPDDGNETLDIGYGSQKRKNNSTAISKVSGNNVETYSSIYDYLRGRVPGVIVGPDNSITIRGISSNNPTPPLILVDGVQTQDLSHLDPSMVQSVEVLKDAASTSIYGIQGGNGVVLISLKKSK